MKERFYYNKVLWLMGLISLWLVGCTSDQVEPGAGTQKSVPIQLVSYMAPYEDLISPSTPASETRGIALTRAGEWLPSGYSEDTDHNAIGLFFTQDSPEKVEAHRVQYGTDSKWRIDGEGVQNPGSYLLYGYTPYNAASVSISKNTSFNNGAVMTISGLSTVMTKDLCVLVGATDGTSTNPITFVPVSGLTPEVSSVNGLYEQSGTDYFITSDVTAQNGKTYYEQKGLAIGKFGCNMHNGNENYIYLLFDHLYSEIDFKFRVDEKYNNLRSIRLKRIEATTYKSADFSTENIESKPLKATVTLQANNTGASPITSITFTTDNSSSESLEQGVLIYKNENPTADDALPCLDADGNKIYSTKKGYILSNAHRYFELRTTYDIYDSKGNLIRKDEQAVNKINTQTIFTNVDKLQRGSRYHIKLTVAPTYLYMLSEPDLDSPTVVVN